MTRRRKRPGAARARRERSAGGVVFRVEHGQPRFLLIRDGYGHWGFPKGHVERGERPEAAALREVMEETGLRALDLVAPISTIAWYFRFKGTLIHKACQFFLMATDEIRTMPQADEGITACQWCAPAEAESLIGYENAREVLRTAVQLVAARMTPPSPATVSSGR